jgi:hypothetical protein
MATRAEDTPTTEWDASLFIDTDALQLSVLGMAETAQHDADKEDAAAGLAEPTAPSAAPTAQRQHVVDMSVAGADYGLAVKFIRGDYHLRIKFQSPLTGEEREAEGTLMDWHVLLKPPADEYDSPLVSALAFEERMALLDQRWTLLAAFMLPTVDNREVPASTVDAEESPRISLRDLMWLRSDSSAMDRYHYAIGVFLQWFGWRLHDGTTGEVDRHREWRARYAALEQDLEKTSRRVVHLLRSLLTMGARSFADRVVHFISQELREGRLLPFREVFVSLWLPLATALSPSAPDRQGKRWVQTWARGAQRYRRAVEHALDSSDSE